MRKFILVCSAALLFSCSGENEYTTEHLNSADKSATSKTEAGRLTTSEFDDLFYNHENSPLFVELTTQTKLFVSKMNFNGNTESIRTKQNMLSWISANLPRTTFSGMGEAVQLLDHIENLSRIDMNANMSFFEKIPTNKLRFADLVLYESMKDVVTSNTPCKDDLNACNSSAVDEYAGAMQGAVSEYLSGSASGETTNNRMNNARVIYQINLKLCQEEFDNCILR